MDRACNARHLGRVDPLAHEDGEASLPPKSLAEKPDQQGLSIPLAPFPAAQGLSPDNPYTLGNFSRRSQENFCLRLSKRSLFLMDILSNCDSPNPYSAAYFRCCTSSRPKPRNFPARVHGHWVVPAYEYVHRHHAGRFLTEGRIVAEVGGLDPVYEGEVRPDIGIDVCELVQVEDVVSDVSSGAQARTGS